ncbi:hypothetical protein AB0M46_34260, partial [Dactylosporangium sp. NPDC051485]
RGEAPIRGRAAVRPATRSLPALGEPPAPAARRRGRSAGIALSALGAAAVAAFALGTLPSRSDHPGAAPTPADTTQAPPSADTPSPTPSDTPTETPSPTPSDTPSDPTEATLAAARAAVQAQAGDGGLDSRTARELNRRLDNLARELARGNDDRAAAEVASLLDRLDQLHQDGTFTGTGYAAVLALADQLAANLPAPAASTGGTDPTPERSGRRPRV